MQAEMPSSRLHAHATILDRLLHGVCQSGHAEVSLLEEVFPGQKLTLPICAFEALEKG